MKMSKIRDVQIPTMLKDRLAQGHPWVYRTHVPEDMDLPDGSWVRVWCGGWSGYALWEAEGPIALRIFSKRQVPDAPWLHARVQAAWELRAPLRMAGCTAYRWLFGEGDGLPGLTVDRYGDFAVIQPYMRSAQVLLDPLVEALRAVAPLHGVLMRPYGNDESVTAEGKTRKVWGATPPQALVVEEYGLRFQAELQIGQKTGLFLDQRENRRFVETISAGRTVLNCFAYTGGFSLAALRGGAQGVVSVDSGRGLVNAAAANIALNGFDAERHDFMTADCFEVLASFVEQQRRFDLVVLDPPSFAKSKQNRFAALRAYTRLNALALRCVAPGGMLATASCTSQVSTEDFKSLLAAAGAATERRFQIFHEAGQAIDHPVPAYFPEGRYLKFVVGRVLDPA